MKQQQHQCVNPDSIRGIRIVYIDLDTVMYSYKFALDINKEKGYDFILTKIGDNILFANEAFDITMEIVNGLNKRYKSKIRQ